MAWDYDGYGLFDRIEGIGVREASLDDECKVIGNIYENPNLLGGESAQDAGNHTADPQ